MTCPRILLGILSVAVLGAPARAAQAAPNCETWNTEAFFETATVEDVTACLDAGSDVMARFDDVRRGDLNATPLHFAARSNTNPAVIQALIDAGADVEAQDDNDDVTPLHEAVFKSQEDLAVIQALLEAGADPNATTNRENLTPLHAANSAAVVHSLLAAGADLEAAARGGASPLYVAVGDENLEVIQALLEAGADPLNEIWRGEYRTPMELADFETLPGAVNREVLELLQAAMTTAGQDCNLWNTKRYFQAAIPESVTHCMEAGADPMARDNSGDTPLHLAVAFNANLEVLQALLDAGAELEARDRYGNTPLHSALSNTNPGVLQALVDAGADLEALDSDGNTPLHSALWMAVDQYNRFERSSYFTAVVQLLLDAGADLEATSGFFGTTAVQMASRLYRQGLPEAIFEAVVTAATK